MAVGSRDGTVIVVEAVEITSSYSMVVAVDNTAMAAVELRNMVVVEITGMVVEVEITVTGMVVAVEITDTMGIVDNRYDGNSR